MIQNNLEFYFSGIVFNDGNAPLDMSADNRNITINGATVTSGITDNIWTITPDNSYDFDASDLATSQSITIECVIKTTTGGRVVSFGNAENFKARGLTISSTGICGFNTYSTNNVYNGSKAINDGKYHHIALVCKFDTPIKLYIDGKLEFTSTNNLSYYTGVMSNTSIFGVIGDLLQKDKTSGTIYLKTLRIYSVALSQGEVLQNYLSELPMEKSEMYLRSEIGEWEKINF